MKKTLSISGMTCGHCSGTVKKALETLEGVASAEVNLEAKKAEVEISGSAPADEQLRKVVEEAGYKVVEIF